MKMATLSVLLVLATTGAIADTTNAFVRPEPSIQSAIDGAARQLSRARTEGDATQIVAALAQKVGNDIVFVQQVLFYLRNGIASEDQGNGAIVLVNLLPVDSRVKVDAAVPYLGASDYETRRIIEGFLDAATILSGNRRDFSELERILRENQPDLQHVLVQYMYHRDPPAAVISMARVYGSEPDEVDIAATIKLEPKIALRSLADRPEWWARLYAAEMFRKNPQLRDPVILKKLEQDEHPLVRERAKGLLSGK